MKILSIETSCDETAVSIIDATGTYEASDFLMQVLGNALMSQMALHAQYGGVFPIMAKREHQKNLVPVLTDTLSQAGMLTTIDESTLSKDTLDKIQYTLKMEGELYAQLLVFLTSHIEPDIDAIAVTYGPGLEPALWVGICFAKALSIAWDLPVVPVNHMEGHILISLLRNEDEVISQKFLVLSKDTSGPTHDSGLMTIDSLAFPSLALLVSGGHTELVLMKDWMHYEVVGQTRDDALGEAFDKVARLMDLPYPGGPQISRLAEEARVEELPSAYKQTRPMIHSKDLDFSFSGLKSSIRRLIESQTVWTQTQKQQLAREFEDTVTDTVVAKVKHAVAEYGIQTLIVGGGVSANKHLRLSLESFAHDTGLQVYLPAAKDATDNALMIAIAGYFRAEKKQFAELENIRAKGTLPLI